MRVTPYYDPLLAKVTVWAANRDQALARMTRALQEFRISGPGVHTTIGFLGDVLAHPLFRNGKHTTSLVEEMMNLSSQVADNGAQHLTPETHRSDQALATRCNRAEQALSRIWRRRPPTEPGRSPRPDVAHRGV